MDVLVLIDKLDDLVHNAKQVPLTDQVRVDKEEITSEGWETRFLRDCDGDHVRAIRKLLDLVAEFHAMEQRGTC